MTTQKEAILDYLEFFFTQEISPLRFRSQLGKFSGQGQRTATFFAQNIIVVVPTSVANIAPL